MESHPDSIAATVKEYVLFSRLALDFLTSAGSFMQPTMSGLAANTVSIVEHADIGVACNAPPRYSGSLQ